MQLKRKKNQTSVDAADSGAASGGRTSRASVSSSREIKVGAGETVVVTPRLSGGYKAMIWFSFLLNFGLFVVLLIGAFVGLRLWGEYKKLAATVPARINSDGLVGQTIAPIVVDAKNLKLAEVTNSSLDLTQQKLGDVMGAVEGLQAATIKANIPIDQALPITLQVPVDQDTVVVVTQPVPLSVPADIIFPGGGGNLRATVALNLPPGLELPVHLALTIPLTSSIPIKLDVPVEIPLRDTELAGPFAKLHELLQPVNDLFNPASGN